MMVSYSLGGEQLTKIGEKMSAKHHMNIFPKMIKVS